MDFIIISGLNFVANSVKLPAAAPKGSGFTCAGGTGLPYPGICEDSDGGVGAGLFCFDNANRILSISPLPPSSPNGTSYMIIYP
jgi:hypothetical protein